MNSSKSTPNPLSAGIDPQLQQQIDRELTGEDIDKLMEQDPARSVEPGDSTLQAASNDSSTAIRHEFRRGRIAAIRGEEVFVELTDQIAKHQGLVPLNQFDRAPRIGSIMDFVVDQIDEDQGLVLLSREGAVRQTTWQQLNRGTVVEARVVSSNKGGLELEMIGGIIAFMPLSQIDIHHVKELEPFVGQKLVGIVQEIDRRSKKVVLSRRQHLQQKQQEARRKLLTELETGQTREGTVTSLVDFGAFVDLGGVDGLIHVSDLSYSRVENPSELLKVGQTLKVKVLKIDPEKQRISLGLKQVEPDPWAGCSERIRAGDQIMGRVTQLAAFGAFIEIEPGVEGLAPLSELSWNRIGHPKEVVAEGQVLAISVLAVDASKKRISLSLKQAEGDPWVGVERRFEKNSLVEGKIRSTTEFGAFVQLERGIEALVHISELSDKRVASVQEVLRVGQSHQFRVLEVDEQQRRIRLTLKPESQRPSKPTEPATPPVQAKAQSPPKDLCGGTGLGGIDLRNLTIDDIK